MSNVSVVAGLSMYTEPGLVAEASARLTELVLARLGRELQSSQPVDLMQQWLNPQLLFAQTCGYPLMHSLKGKVQLIATPCYDLPGCQGNLHCSWLIVREDDPRQSLSEFHGSVAALNGYDSNSGMNLFRHKVAQFSRDGRFFREVLLSGAHVLSLNMVAQGAADLACIDAVTFGYLQLHEPSRLRGVRILEATASSPALPLIGAITTTNEMCLSIIGAFNACLKEAPLLSQTLALKGFVRSSVEDYQLVLDYQQRANELGYSTLA
jgi:ABC-type phosphate/phosphonate transport system substrate-binding protein